MRRSVTIIITSIIFCLPLVSIAAIDDTASTVLVTGANRGLGFEFASQYAADGWNVIATARKPDAAEKIYRRSRRNTRGSSSSSSMSGISTGLTRWPRNMPINPSISC